MDDLNIQGTINNQNQILGMSVEEFLDTDILKMIGAGEISQEEKNNIYKKMVDTISNRVILKIDDLLQTEENRNKFKSLLEKNDSAAMENFFVEFEIDVKDLIMQETLIYKTELVSLAKSVDENNK